MAVFSRDPREHWLKPQFSKNQVAKSGDLARKHGIIWYNTRCPMVGDPPLTTHRMRYSTAYPKGAEHIKKSSKAYRHVHFAVMAIENAAKRMKIPSWEMYRRLKAQNLIRNRLLSHYDALHTQGIDWVAEDTVETLLNWEAAEQSCSRQRVVTGDFNER